MFPPNLFQSKDNYANGIDVILEIWASHWYKICEPWKAYLPNGELFGRTNEMSVLHLV